MKGVWQCVCMQPCTMVVPGLQHCVWVWLVHLHLETRAVKQSHCVESCPCLEVAVHEHSAIKCHCIAGLLDAAKLQKGIRPVLGYLVATCLCVCVCVATAAGAGKN